MCGGWTGVAASEMGKIIAITPTNTIPGHLAEPGRLSEIQELRRAPKMVMKFIYNGQPYSLARKGLMVVTHAKRNDVDLCDRKDGRLSCDIVTLHPKYH